MQVVNGLCGCKFEFLQNVTADFSIVISFGEAPCNGCELPLSGAPSPSEDVLDPAGGGRSLLIGPKSLQK